MKISVSDMIVEIGFTLKFSVVVKQCHVSDMQSRECMGPTLSPADLEILRWHCQEFLTDDLNRHMTCPDDPLDVTAWGHH